MSKSCTGLLDELVACVASSGCVTANGRSIKACTADADATPECQRAREVRARAACAQRCAGRRPLAAKQRVAACGASA